MNTMNKRATISAAVLVSQILFVLLLAPQPTGKPNTYERVSPPSTWMSFNRPRWMERYYLLNNWDSVHFYELAMNGYHLPAGKITPEDAQSFRANVTIPPAYPLFVRWVSWVFRVPIELALLLVAQSMCFLLWYYFLSILEHWKVGGSWKWLVALAAFPSTFYLVTGYTESLFLACSLGVVYWSERWFSERKHSHWALAAVHGFICAATRISGFLIAFYPAALLIRGKKRKFADLARISLLSLVSSSGFFLFLAYCQARFGNWAIYFQLGKIGWGRKTDWVAPFNPFIYIPHFFFEDTVYSIGKTCAFLCASLLIWLVAKDAKRVENAGLYAVASTMLYVAVAGSAYAGLDGCVRYMLPVFAFLIMAWAKVAKGQKRGAVALWIPCALSLATQGWLAFRFLRGRWVS